ncbi:hypothetical protein P4493_10820 [Bacillus thuringiensis]|uniref:Phage protein n=10 Tax=Bacillus cereus group TaxID=86661 RepID=A0AB35PBP5_BACTU|nr:MULTISPECIES: hypothetical protein [Bacillus]ARO21518.1 hypothetical protein B2J90_29435 [Bacillus cereus]EAO57415.1 hypothetical protein RBTH_07699 [Bacillus thuringiensis serovar israelensis ATCC 35646]AFQ30248.1 major structural protein [Bacillus thuringiensis HD-789]AJH02423.1 putative major structural protein [Bacillus thuringiensis HD1002]AND28440.1 hypothetical protein ATN07_32440 [Bacillus thuringiensis serovar israelensis]
MSTTASRYSKTFTTYGGSDIVCTFNGQVVGQLQAITYSVTREKGPVYVMGDPNPKSFSRGKRGIAGSLVFTIFDRDALFNLKQQATVHRHGLNQTDALASSTTQVLDVDANAAALTQRNDLVQGWQTKRKANFIDEIPPFDITINFLNEYGQASKMEIYGVEILNEGMGLSVDDNTTEKACTFIARNIVEMRPQDDWEVE